MAKTNMWLEKPHKGLQNLVNKRDITLREFDVGETVVANFGRRRFTAKVIEQPTTTKAGKRRNNNNKNKQLQRKKDFETFQVQR